MDDVPANGRDWLSPQAALERFRPVEEQGAPGQLAYQLHSTRYGFRVGSIGFLIPPHTVAEVIEPPRIYPLPNTQSWLLGMIKSMSYFCVLQIHLCH